MRLTPEAIQTITQAAQARWGDGACVRLFGSRLDDAAKGGDIDLHIIVPAKLDNPLWESAQFAAYLQRQLEGRKVDVRLLEFGQEQISIDRVALAVGVLISTHATQRLVERTQALL
ncbi:nucleotidyltransferase domain-containing protein [Limnohabitans sp. JirII-29]|uniref:nucleotidyltransferase domain-containing protein n=1 Tax=Limnohabitans sp. JirII-29 TaxID=1835756 RepID=UPI0011B261C1|nr:nucleotidyltransferase domain-containing protein [Limnohabitans sp. JirII-29]